MSWQGGGGCGLEEKFRRRDIGGGKGRERETERREGARLGVHVQQTSGGQGTRRAEGAEDASGLLQLLLER